MSAKRHFLPLIALLLAASAPALAQNTTGSVKGDSAGDLMGKDHGPMQVTADQGIEWQQNAHAYIARGNAMAKRGNVTLRADTLTAFYRDQPNNKGTEIWRVTAEGHVHISTPTQSLTGDKGVYDLDQSVAVITGKDLRLTTPRDVVTAENSMEWYEAKQLAVARGNALVVQGDRRLHADVLAAQLSKDAPASGAKPAAKPAAAKPGQNGDSTHISRVDAVGHVLVSGPDQVGTGDQGVYDVDRQLATSSGHVTLTRGNNTLAGEYGVVDFRNNISRLLPKPGGVATVTANGQPPAGRVEGYLVPRQKPEGAAQPAPARTP